MGSGGGGSSVSSASGVPPWMKNNQKNLLQNAEEWAYTRDFPAYDQNDRIAGFSSAELASQQATGDMFNAGDPYAGMALQGLGQAAGSLENISDVNSGYAANQFDFGKFGQQQMNDYMNPFQQGVTDTELRTAAEEFQRQQNRSDAESVSSGSRGGYREALNQMMGRQLQGQTLADIQGRGSLAAYQNAQQQYERDRGAAIQAAEMGDSSAYRAAQLGLEAGGMNQRVGLDRAKAYRDIGMSTSDLANQQQNREMARIEGVRMAGERQRQLEQARMDLGYEEFMREYNEPKDRMNFIASMLQGIPSQSISYNQNPGQSTFSNIVGAGLGAAGVARKLQGN